MSIRPQQCNNLQDQALTWKVVALEDGVPAQKDMAELGLAWLFRQTPLLAVCSPEQHTAGACCDDQLW